MTEEYFWIAIVVVLLIILIIGAGYLYAGAIDDKKEKEFMTPVNAPTSNVSITYQGYPMSISRNTLGLHIRNIKNDLITAYSKVGALMCQQALIPKLEVFRAELTRQTANETLLQPQSGHQFCKEVRQYMAQTPKQNTHEANQELAKRLSRSDTNLNNDLTELFDDIIHNLDAVLHVVVNNLCGIDNRIDLDYLNHMIDEISKVCDVNRQSMFVEPTADQIEDIALRALTGGKEQSQQPRRSRIPGAGTRPISIGNRPDEIEVIQIQQPRRPSSIPTLMSQIARGDEGFTDEGDGDERIRLRGIIPRNPFNGSPAIRKIATR